MKTEQFAEQFEEQTTAAVNSVFGVVATAQDTVVLEKMLAVIVSLGIGILRGLKGDEWVEDYLTAAIKDKENRIEVEKTPLH